MVLIRTFLLCSGNYRFGIASRGETRYYLRVPTALILSVRPSPWFSNRRGRSHHVT